ncbi:MAG: tetratricopeptide repeat protein [Candidatus Obscuribacter sp.]|nr:tetratricopeptide repeat protein [Candidatus Obscuribacter sp.]
MICPGNSALAQGFPGKGEPGAWSDALPHYNLGNRYLEHERLDEAIEQYQVAISLYQYDPDFYINLGLCPAQNQRLCRCRESLSQGSQPQR